MNHRRVSRALSDVTERSELFDVAMWNGMIGGTKKRLGPLLAAKREFPGIDVGLPAAAVWGFDTQEAALRLFYGSDPDAGAVLSCPFERRRFESRDFLRLGIKLYELKSSVPTLEQVERLLTETRVAGVMHAEEARFRKFVKKLVREYFLHWMFYEKMIVAGIFNIRMLVYYAGNNSNRTDTDINITKKQGKEIGSADISRIAFGKMEDFLTRLYDYHRLKNRIWENVPLDVYSIKSRDVDRIIKVFCDPIAFDPRNITPKDVFLWPWQRCLAATKTDASYVINYRPILTVSLVVDLRASTTAMSLTSNAAAYTDFLDSVVRQAKLQILNSGGYFDKETGDGVVGHFCDNEAEYEMLSADATNLVERVILAARNIVQAVSSLCRAFQQHLEHGLEGLGPAVGIHLGNAIWVTSDGQIRAIGASVVGASRLCSVASCHEILVSNIVYNNLKLDSNFVIDKKFVRRSITMKEIRDGAGLFAYGWVI